LEIYQAVEKVKVFSLHRSPPNPKCVVGRNITNVLQDVAEQAEHAVRDVIGNKSLEDVAKAVLQQESSRGKKNTRLAVLPRDA
jgi:DNA-binding IscR family transcriptional regulator